MRTSLVCLLIVLLLSSQGISGQDSRFGVTEVDVFAFQLVQYEYTGGDTNHNWVILSNGGSFPLILAEGDVFTVSPSSLNIEKSGAQEVIAVRVALGGNWVEAYSLINGGGFFIQIDWDALSLLYNETTSEILTRSMINNATTFGYTMNRISEENITSANGKNHWLERHENYQEAYYYKSYGVMYYLKSTSLTTKEFDTEVNDTKFEAMEIQLQYKDTTQTTSEFPSSQEPVSRVSTVSTVSTIKKIGYPLLFITEFGILVCLVGFRVKTKKKPNW